MREDGSLGDRQTVCFNLTNFAASVFTDSGGAWARHPHLAWSHVGYQNYGEWLVTRRVRVAPSQGVLQANQHVPFLFLSGA
jgi:hypothetical protein